MQPLQNSPVARPQSDTSLLDHPLKRGDKPSPAVALQGLFSENFAEAQLGEPEGGWLPRSTLFFSFGVAAVLWAAIIAFAVFA